MQRDSNRPFSPPAVVRRPQAGAIGHAGADLIASNDEENESHATPEPGGTGTAPASPNRHLIPS